MTAGGQAQTASARRRVPIWSGSRRTTRPCWTRSPRALDRSPGPLPRGAAARASDRGLHAQTVAVGSLTTEAAGAALLVGGRFEEDVAVPFHPAAVDVAASW
jgi:hypothetical protein